MVAAYGFDEASGSSATDASGHNNAGTFGSGVSRTTYGRFGRALTFNGSYVTVPDAPSLDLTTAMTIEAWVYPTAAASGWATAVLKEQSGQYSYALYNSAPSMPSGEINVGTAHSGERISMGPSQLPLNSWTHLASTYDGQTVRLYVNGAPVATRSATGSISQSSRPLRIGGNAIWGEFFKGRIDEVRIYNRVLSGGEIQTDMTKPVSGAPADATEPGVYITSPTSGATYTTTATSLSVSGTSGDNVGVTQVTWANNRGGSGTASGTYSWSAANIALQTGSNVLTVTARDAANNVATTTLTVIAGTVTAPTPTTLAITSQPSVAQSGSALSTIAVQLRDPSNAAVGKSGVVVTAARASGTASLGGTLTATTNASGTATFGSLVLSGSGAETLRFTASGLTAATSAAITVNTALQSPPSGNFVAPNILNNASFETGWDGFTNGAGGTPTAKRDNSRAYAGSWSMMTSWSPNGSSEGGTHTFYDFAGSDRVWVRFYFRLTAPITSIMKFARFYSPNGRNTNFGGLFIQSGGSILGFGSDRENGAAVTWIGLSQNQVADGNWHSIEMDYWRNGDPSGYPSIGFWFDGAQVSMPNGRNVVYSGETKYYWSNGRLYTGERSSSEKLGSLEWLATLNAGNTTTGQLNIDRIAISTAGRIGP